MEITVKIRGGYLSNKISIVRAHYEITGKGGDFV